MSDKLQFVVLRAYIDKLELCRFDKLKFIGLTPGGLVAVQSASQSQEGDQVTAVVD